MAEDSELEKRAIEELLRETDRARVRAETMGPAGWLKCPLQATNKRFLLNTLRSTSTQQRSAEPTAGHGTTRGYKARGSPDRSRQRSRTPPRHNKRGHADSKRHHRDNIKDKRCDGGKDDRQRRHKDRGQNRDKDRHRLHKGLSPEKNHSSSSSSFSSRSHAPSRQRSGGGSGYS
ncbi:protein POLR1D [Thalassophryne amazonica]|uniref:protein POLR1D n=1 Tax=Thalassophryne amazonica TaxID=390379 RepID=UPI001470A419|nr:protein POLR1D [Thalassophryne amazonica]